MHFVAGTPRVIVSTPTTDYANSLGCIQIVSNLSRHVGAAHFRNGLNQTLDRRVTFNGISRLNRHVNDYHVGHATNTPEILMKTLLSAFALSVVALSSFAAETQAREADFVYQVWACEMPTYAVQVRPGVRNYDSFHFSLADAEDRADQLTGKGVNAEVVPVDGYTSKKHIYDNSFFVKEFDDSDEALDFADELEEHTGWFCWVKKVEVYSWGP